MSRSRSSADIVKQLTASLKTIKKVHQRSGMPLAGWWAQQGQDERLQFLLGWCPYMPLAPDKPYMYVDGTKQDVSGAALLCPELNQQDLLQGNQLPELLRAIAEVEGPEGYDDLTELFTRNIPAAARLVGKVKSHLSKEERTKGLVKVLPGEDFGTMYVVRQVVPSLQSMLQMGALIPAPAFEAVQLRLQVLLDSVAMCLDHFRVEFMGRPAYKAIAPQLGCARCGALEAAEGGGSLKACAACGAAFYCSRECQRAHWKAHKPDCKPTTTTAAVDAGSPAAAPADSAASQQQAGKSS